MITLEIAKDLRDAMCARLAACAMAGDLYRSSCLLRQVRSLSTQVVILENVELARRGSRFRFVDIGA